MVRELDNRWNRFESNLRSLQIKLSNLGLILKEDEIIYLENKVNYHV